MANVHKDFHGSMSYGIQHLHEKHGERELLQYLKQVAHTVYSPLIEALKTKGLPALYEHWDYIFTIEGADFEMSYQENDLLLLRVKKCPAVHHMQEHNYQVAERYCEHCQVTNEEICHSAGYECSIEYGQSKGSCVQEFWKKIVNTQ